MSGPLGSQQWMYSTGFYPYEIDQSLRFNDDDSAYLSRTPASAGNRKTWTWSGWVKLGDPSNRNTLFATQYTNGNSTTLWIEENIKINQVGPSGYQLYLQSNAVLRDVSSWYHIVLLMDTTQATASDRTKIWVNGQEQLLTGVSGSSYPAQNLETHVNELSEPHYLGCEDVNILGGVVRFLDGYMAEVNFVDGQALDATSFGEFKSGVWIPKEYEGTYGTNGFYLDFGNSGSLGADSSGNGNNWTPNNLAATDQVLDSPTNNFCTFSPAALDEDRDYASLLTEGNLRINRGIVSGEGGSIGAPMAVSSGKWYFEGELSEYSGSSTLRIGFNHEDNMNGSGNAYKQVSANGLYMIAIDVDNEEYWTGTNGTWDAGDPDAGTGGTAYSSSVKAMLPFVRDNSGSVGNGGTWTVNFGQDSSFAGNKTRQGNTDANGIGDFYYAPPAGYLALCTANLPNPAIDPALDDVPADYFNTVLYTGNGSTQSITGVGFQPDFVWFKSRSLARTHLLVNSNVGFSKVLQSNLNNSEETTSKGITSVNSDGFTIEHDGITPLNSFNESGASIVAWNWLAGNGTSINTDGIITSIVSANQKAGFSIVSYTGNGASSATVGHGLGSTPEMIIFKARSDTGLWHVSHSGLTNMQNYTIYLNDALAQFSDSVVWGNTAPTSTVFGVGTDGVYAYANKSGSNFIAYCFHSVEGYSKFGSYTGNGSTDGPFVYTGFRPAFVLIKKATGSAADWFIGDSARSEYNPVGVRLMPNLSDAEAATSIMPDMLSNGFKLRSSASSVNSGTITYIYMAFAEMPFKYSNAR